MSAVTLSTMLVSALCAVAVVSEGKVVYTADPASSSRFANDVPMPPISAFHMCIFKCDACYPQEWVKVECANMCIRSRGAPAKVGPKWAASCPYFTIPDVQPATGE